MCFGLPEPAWPEGNRFAFTIVDDTDWASVVNVRPVYEFLAEIGLKTTKTVWPLAASCNPRNDGQSLEDPDYRDWVLGLKNHGFEIAIHGVSSGTSRRDRVERGLDYFREVIGGDPSIHTNHTGQSEAIYWGAARLDGLTNLGYRWAWKLTRGEDRFHGHEEGSPLFWGDLCRERIKYVRNLVFDEINTIKIDPLMPYHDPRRHYVRHWFSSSEGLDPRSFNRLLRESHQDRLLQEGGACIVYTHFGAGFWKDGRLDPEFVRLMRRLAGMPGWFVPASTLLDYLGEKRGWMSLGESRHLLNRMQRTWLLGKLVTGRS